jgi:ketol-acid reductoisomerase
VQQIRIGNAVENVVERADLPGERVRAVLGAETVAVLGYGSQGRAQALNLRDGGFRVVVGAREGGPSARQAQDDGWSPGQTLFPLPEAARRGTLVAVLLSDAGQKEQWPPLSPHLTPGKAVAFAHGFGLVYRDETGVVPPPGADVFLVAPRGSGTTLRRSFQEGKGLSASFAVCQDATGRARERAWAYAFAAGCRLLFETTLEREVRGDLTGERGTLLGAIYGLWLAQYEVLRAHGHPPAEAFSETVEEATQSLYPLIAEKGMGWMCAHCSTTAQRGALDWFARFRDAVKPVFEELYRQVASGAEARRALEANRRPDYRRQLEEELRAVAEGEMWQAGAAVRALRPDAGPQA